MKAQAGGDAALQTAGGGNGSGGEVLAEAAGPDGESLILRRSGGGFEILRQAPAAVSSDPAAAAASTAPTLLMASSIRRCEGELVNFVMGPLRDRHDITLLLAGLGMGYTLSAILASPRVIRVDVVEHSAAIIEWNRSHLSTLHHEPPLADPRVHVHQMGLADYLRGMRYGTIAGLSLEGGGYLGVLLDLDHGPGKLLRPQNASLYSDEGLADLEEALRPGGVLVLWSEDRNPELLARMQRFQNLAEVAYPVDVPGSPGLDYLYRGRRRANPPRPKAQA